ncbi:MAG: excinuclease ABC subunit UvrC [Candidatus Gastranaerophilales bacterium]|nr:excinuclease ABC subunit UvrC [Candidatus Gastranaerophilales bacterium]
MDIKEQLRLIPESSGSYQFFDKEDTIIYVGKAKNLKRRVSSYFNKKHDSAKLAVMVPQIVKIEFIITNSEIEALILESHLIKKYKPKYNILLKDDKKFPYFLITKEDYPRILVTRKRNKNMLEGKYFGPYTNAKSMYTTLDLLKRLFPLKQCKTPKFKDRPCIYYQIGRCMAPCQKLISSSEYKKLIKNVELFLSGKQMQLVYELKSMMEKYSLNQEYEKAAKYRDSYFDVLKTIEKQKVVYENTNINQDVISLSSDEYMGGISLLQIRDGRLTNKKDFEISKSDYDSEEEIISFFIKEYYQMSGDDDIPSEIIFSSKISQEDKSIFESWLSSKKGSKVLINPDKTKKNEEILELALKNSNYHLKELKIQSLQELQNNFNEAGSYIQEKLKLNKFPHRVECFDISHIQGTNTVASMVSFYNGMPKKSEYKRYKIKTVEEGKPDDFKSMREVIKRRYSRLLNEGKEFPDLIIIDGGKGQLSSAAETLNELGIKNQDIISIAKRIEEIFIPCQSQSVIFPMNSQALFFFQRIRDEAHRFAITFHRHLREKGAVHSEFDDIKGLYKKNKKLLIEKYGSVAKISKLTKEELMLLVSKSQAQIIYDYFNTESKKISKNN